MLVTQGLSRHELGVLEDHRSVAEDVVDCASDVTVSVELAEAVSVEGVLECINLAPVNDRLIGSDAKCDCLLFLWPSSVLEPYILAYESIRNSSCKWYQINMRSFLGQEEEKLSKFYHKERRRTISVFNSKVSIFTNSCRLKCC